MIEKQPEALRLADEISSVLAPYCGAAAELRRLHAENEELRAQIGQGVPDGWRIEHVSDGEIRLYGPKNIWPGMGETWLIQSGHDGFYGFLHRFFTAMLASAPPAPQQKPMTVEQIWENDALMALNAEAGLSMTMLEKIVGIVEAAHNIGEKK